MRRESEARNPSSNDGRDGTRSLWIVTVPVVAILMLTATAMVLHGRVHRQAVQMAFDQNGDQITYLLAQRLSIYAETLQSVSALFEASGRVDEATFTDFAERVCGDHPEIQGIGWAPRVAASERDEFVRQQRRRLPGFELQRWVGNPAADGGRWRAQGDRWAETYYPLTWFWPQSANANAAGIDFFSHPGRREVIEAAMRENKTMASRPLEIVSRNDQTRGIVMARPIGSPPLPDQAASPSQAPSVVVAALRFAPIVEAVLSVQLRQTLRVCISDDSSVSTGQSILYRDPQFDRRGVPSPGWQPGGKRPGTQKFVQFGGRRYRCEFVATDQFIASQDSPAGLWIALGGLATAVMAGALIQSLVSRTDTIQRTVDQRTEAIRVANDHLAIAKAEVEAVFHSTPTPLLVVDQGDRVTGANQAARSLFGDRPGEEIVGRRLNEMIWWPRRPAEASVCSELINRDATPEGAVGVRDNSNAFPIETRCRQIRRPGQPHVSQSQPPAIFLLSITDLTERLQNQESLRESEQRMDLALTGADLGTWDWDLINDQITYSDRWGEMLGLQPHQLRGSVQLWKGLIHPSDLQPAQAAMRDHLDGRTEQYNAEYRMRHSAGHWIWVLARGRITHRGIEGRPRRICGTQMDITDRRTAEEKLRDKQVEIQQIFEALPDAVVVTNLQRQIVLVNSAFSRIFGYDAKEAVGRPTQFFYADPDDDQRLRADGFDRRGSIDYRPYEINYRRQNGEIFPSETIGTTVLDGHHRVVGHLGLIRDITERRQAETELEESYAALKVSNTALRLSNAELDQFAYVASHDLRGPLRGIAYLAQWVIEDCGEALTQEGQKHLADMQRMIRRMEQFLTDLLSYSRIGRKPVEVQRLELGPMLSEMKLMVDPNDEATLRWPDRSLVMVTARSTLQRVLLNLISNAIRHHIKPSGDTISRSSPQSVRPVVQIGWRELVDPSASPAASADSNWSSNNQSESMVQFTVDDNGPGIEPEFRDRVFDMFCTLRPRDEVEGSGMGLAIVKKLIETRGGTIRVDESPLGGARFVFTWPMNRDLPVPPTSPTSSPQRESTHPAPIAAQSTPAIASS